MRAEPALEQRGEAARLYEGYKQQAFDLMTSGKAREAFAIQKESARVRERYGRNRWGQCVLLAVWGHVGAQMRELLDSFSLSDIAEMSQGERPWPDASSSV